MTRARKGRILVYTNSIGGKPIDPTNLADGTVIVYDQINDVYHYVDLTTVFALIDHTHSQYLTEITKAMVEGVLTGNITTHVHSQYLTAITKAMVEAVLTGTITTHNHNGTYALVAHNHDADYSPIGHDHAGVYAPATHSHAEYLTGITKAMVEAVLTGTITSHNHSGVYALVAHNHDGVYEPVITKNTAFNKNFGTTAGTVAEGNHTHSQYLQSITKAMVEGVLTGTITSHNHSGVYAPASHVHDDRYYTETEVDDLLAGKSGTAHTHDDRYFTESEVTNLLAGKADSGHNHSGVYEPAFTKNTAFNKNFGTTVGTVCQGNDSRLSDARTPTAHTHDDRYFTETEVNNLLAGKAASSHTHNYAGSSSAGGSANTAVKLHTARAINGVSFDGSADIKNSEWFHSGRDFPNGTLVTTDINYGVTNGDPWILEIKGNSYGSVIPFDIQVQGYIYNNTMINVGGYSNGTNISGLVALNVSNNLCFWFPNQSYWHGYNVRVYAANSNPINRVASIQNIAKPAGTKEVALTALIRQSLHSDNFTSYAATAGHNHSGVYEPAFSKGTAFNKNFGTTAGTVCQGNDSRLSDARTPTAHTHDDRYYTETEVNNLLAGKAASSHTHDDRYYTESEVNSLLAGKSDTSHTHSYLPLSGGSLTGKVAAGSATRSAGMYGYYVSTAIGHVWSMGTGYSIPDNGADFGNLYGMAYKHTNNPTGGTMAGGHQIVFCNAGSPGTAIGLAGNVWTSGGFLKNGSSDSYLLLGGGGHKAISDFATSSHNHSGVYEPAFSKNNAFNKNFGTASGTVCQGNDSRLSNERTPSNGSVTYAKISTDLTSRQAVSASDINWSAGGVYTKTLTAATTFTFSNLQLNKVITLVASGNFTITLPAYCKRISGEYDGSTTNYIQFHCTNNASGSEEVWYTISQQAT